MKRFLTKITLASAILIGLIAASELPPLGERRFLQARQGGAQGNQQPPAGTLPASLGTHPAPLGSAPALPSGAPFNGQAPPLGSVNIAGRKLKGDRNGPQGSKLPGGTGVPHSHVLPSGNPSGHSGRHLKGENKVAPSGSFGVRPSHDGSRPIPDGSFVPNGSGSPKGGKGGKGGHRLLYNLTPGRI